jgi:putative tricarboxylic transport membrane protein
VSGSTARGRTLDLAVSAGLALAGAFFALQARRMSLGPDPTAPGPGAAPFWLGLVMVACGLALGFATLVSKQPDDTVASDEPHGQRKTMISLALLAGCVVLFEPLGFMLSTFAFLAIGFVWLGDAPARTALPAAAIATTGLWLIFTKLLGVGLPYGLIAEVLFK